MITAFLHRVCFFGPVLMLMNVCRLLRTLTNTDETLRTLTNSDETLRTSTNSDETLRTSTNADETQRTPTNSDETLRTPTNSDETLRTPTNSDETLQDKDKVKDKEKDKDKDKVKDKPKERVSHDTLKKDGERDRFFHIPGFTFTGNERDGSVSRVRKKLSSVMQTEIKHRSTLINAKYSSSIG